MIGPTSPLWTDTTVTSTATAVFAFKAAMKAAGWTVTSSGDGTANYNASGDTITSSATGAHGISNAKSWFILKSPGQVNGAYVWLSYQTVSFVGTNGDTPRVKFSRTGWNGGSPAQAVVPSITGTDTEAVILGAGTDAAPSGSNLFTWRSDPASTTTNLAGFADQAAPYGFSYWGYQLEPSTNTNVTSKPRFMLDPLVRTGAYDSLNYAIHAYGASGTTTAWEPQDQIFSSGGTPPAGPPKGSDASGAYGTIYPCALTNNSFRWPPGAGNNGASVDAWSGNYTLFPVVYGNNTVGAKGISTLMYQVAQAQLAATARAALFSANGGTKNYYWNGGYALPWSGIDPSIGVWTTFSADAWALSPYEGDKHASVTITKESDDVVSGTGTYTDRASASITEAGDSSSASASAPVDTTPPAITNFSPAGATQVLSGTALTFDITDPSLRLTAVVAYFPDGTYEVVFDGTGFAAGYASTSTIATISGGYHFSVLRVGGWAQAPTLRFPVVDAGGNIGVIS